MFKRYHSYIILFTIVLVTDCIEPFDVSFSKYENLLVVDGMITNEPGPYTVKLSRSASTENFEYTFISNATVIISDNTGNSEVLTQTDEGVYSTTESGIQGISNNSYKIYIKTPDGNEYESKFQKLQPQVDIDSLYGIVDFQSTDNSNLLHEGYKFLIETETLINDSNFFMWIPFETYKYYADYRIDYYFLDGEVYVYPDPYAYYTCWKTNRIQNVYVLKTGNNNNFVQFTLNFVSADTNKLSEGYSLSVKQYSINYEEYIYWKNIEKLLIQGQSFYNVQPFQTLGNVENIDDPEEPVLGYFSVAGVSEKRIFVNPIQPTYYYSYCVPDPLSWQRALTYGSVGIVYGVEIDNGIIGRIGGACIFCTNNGGTTVKPDFWNN